MKNAQHKPKFNRSKYMFMVWGLRKKRDFTAKEAFALSNKIVAIRAAMQARIIALTFTKKDDTTTTRNVTLSAQYTDTKPSTKRKAYATPYLTAWDIDRNGVGGWIMIDATKIINSAA